MWSLTPSSFRNCSMDGYLAVFDKGVSNADNAMTEEWDWFVNEATTVIKKNNKIKNIKIII